MQKNVSSPNESPISLIILPAIPQMMHPGRTKRGVLKRRAKPNAAIPAAMLMVSMEKIRSGAGPFTCIIVPSNPRGIRREPEIIQIWVKAETSLTMPQLVWSRMMSSPPSIRRNPGIRKSTLDIRATSGVAVGIILERMAAMNPPADAVIRVDR